MLPLEKTGWWVHGVSLYIVWEISWESIIISKNFLNFFFFFKVILTPIWRMDGRICSRCRKRGWGFEQMKVERCRRIWNRGFFLGGEESWPQPQHAEVPRPGIEPKPQQWSEPEQWQCQVLNHYEKGTPKMYFKSRTKQELSTDQMLPGPGMGKGFMPT